MADNFVHITNGDAFTTRLKQHFPEATLLTWNEILCEGPSVTEVFSQEFITTRSQYLIEHYEASHDSYLQFTAQFDEINKYNSNGLVLWFEYDLFCQINLAALVYFLKEQNPETPLYLVCSGRIEGYEGLFGLNELDDEQLLGHFRNKKKLSATETDLLCEFWNLYSGRDHRLLASRSFESEKLEYLKMAKEAHIRRYPDNDTGINRPERMVIEAISQNSFENERKLIGFLLRNQGHYGFGDMQWEKIVCRMRPFFTSEKVLHLTSEGIKLLNSEINILNEIKDSTQFGGCSKYDYFYDRTSKKLITA